MATEKDSDVTPDSSKGVVENEETVETSDSSSVTNDATDLDRPLHNVKAEMDRKLGKVEERFATIERSLTDMVGLLTNVVNTRGTTSTPTDTPITKEYTDEQLMEYWQAGSKEAGDMLLDRKLDRKLAANRQTENANTFVSTQLRALYTKYPVLKDATHPLTKAALATRSALVSAGMPMTLAVDLEAIKTAIADNPDLAVQALKPTLDVNEESRKSASDQAGGGFGVNSKRSDTSKRGVKPQLSEAQLELAKRMGVKDPAGSRARMTKRIEERKSSVSPLLLTFVEEK